MFYFNCNAESTPLIYKWVWKVGGDMEDGIIIINIVITWALVKGGKKFEEENVSYVPYSLK